MKITWLTDIHLNFLDRESRFLFYNDVVKSNGDIVLISGDPFFSSKATGDVLMQVAKENTSIEFLVLCGHTHENAHYQPMNNLTIEVGRAEYFHPEVQKRIDLS